MDLRRQRLGVILARARRHGLRLWTVQHRDALRELVTTGRLRADEARADSDCRHAYDWMRRQARRRIPGSDGGPLLWAWARPARYTAAIAAGGRAPRVCLELRAAPERALLSDFALWHAVLNWRYASLTEAEAEAWDERVLAATGWWDTWRRELPEPLRAEQLASWERIFDLDRLARKADAGYLAPLEMIQAVLHEIRLEDVVAIRFLDRG